MAKSYEDFVAGYGATRTLPIRTSWLGTSSYLSHLLRLYRRFRKAGRRFTAAFKQSLGAQAAGMGQLTEDVGMGASALRSGVRSIKQPTQQQSGRGKTSRRALARYEGGRRRCRRIHPRWWPAV